MMKKLALDLPGSYKVSDPSGFASKQITDILSELLPYIFTLAGLALLLYLIWGGFELLTSAGDPKRMEAGQKRLTNAVVGFVIIFVSYWITRVLETVLGIEILG